MKALFIHGLNSSNNSTTGKVVSSILNDMGIETEIYSYDPLNIEEALDAINKRLSKLDIDFVVGHSLGGFYALMCYNGPVKIVINPCMYPSIEIPKLESISKKTINDFKRIEKNYKNIDFDDISCTYGIFTNNDPLFSYYDDFKSIYSNAYMIKGEHVIRNRKDIEGTLYHIVDVCTSTDRITEKMRTVFVQESSYEAKQYVDEVYDILYKAYEDIGGPIGCNSPESLLNDSDIWKLGFKNKELLAVVVYSTRTVGRKVKFLGAKKDENGNTRKDAKEALYQIIEEDLRKPGPLGALSRKMWAEVSGGPENVYLKKFNGKVISPYDVSKIKNEPITDVEPDGHYSRRIGTEFHRKIAVSSDKYNPIEDFNKLKN